MEEKIIKKIESIYQHISLHQSESPALFSGQSGIILFVCQYAKKKDCEMSNYFQDSFDKIIDYSFTSLTFCDGLSGFHWILKYLNKEEIIDDIDLFTCLSSNVNYQDFILSEIKKSNYDFLYGSIGVVYSLLYNNRSINTELIEELFIYLKRFFNNKTALLRNYFLSLARSENEFENLGLSHGMASILKFCLICINIKVCEADVKYVALAIINKYMSYNRCSNGLNYFPNNKNTNNVFSRLAWCYGDLSIGYILYQAGKTFNDQKIIDFALEVLHHTTKRRTIEETMVLDAGFCHGSAGVAHIYNRMWYYTKKTIFKEATDFWIQKTLDFAIHEDGVAGYKKYNPTTKTYENDYGLLEGAAGIGLVLHSYLTGDFSWDYCLMLNNLSADGTY